MEELTVSLWARIQEEIRARDDQLNQFKHLLNQAITERNEARKNYQSLLQQQIVEDEHIANSGFSSSDCEESIVSSPENPVQLLPPTKRLPEKGKFLEAVMKAGPLLQNLLLTGPLPHWRHPPPPLESYQIPSPPWVISTQPLHYLPHNRSEFNKKRGFSEDCCSSTETKYQRISF